MDPSDRSRTGSTRTAHRFGRRDFLRGAVAGLGLGLLPRSARAEGGAPRVRRRVVLGRTGIEVPDIGFGSSRLSGDVDLVRYALDRGVTHFDTAEGYTEGASERTIGRALLGKRDRITLTSKTQAGARASRDEMMAALEGSLRRLQTDYVDLYFNHAVNDVRRLQNPEWAEFTSRAKEQGKIRFTGLSGHGGRLVECLDHAIDQDIVDAVLVGYNFGQDPSFFQKFTSSMDFVAVQPDLPRVLAKAKQKNVGVMAMKTLRGAKLNDMRPFERGGATYAQAAFRWTLSSPNVDSLVVTMKSREMVDEYVAASGWTAPKTADIPLLQEYEARNGATQCRYGCNACEGSCPHGVPIADVLRTRMYDRDYGDFELARAEYAKLGAGASPCLGCAHETCAGACPFGLSIPDLTEPTHRRLIG